MTDLNIRDIPPDLLYRAKLRATYLGLTLKKWIMELITKALEEKAK
jgi:hypothetical protein